MRLIRLLLALATSFLALTFLVYVAYGSPSQGDLGAASAKKGRLRAFFSFTSPASLFPPSAIISLTDDNSTFFLARPAAFGPLLPSNGLSGQLWIGSGFVEDAMGGGELGCGDVPGWSDGESSATGARATFEFGHGEISEHADIQSLQETAEIAGKVVLLKRGGCGFLDKVKWAQTRGGVAVIVGDNVRGGSLVRMYARGDTSSVNIPAIFTSQTTAQLLSSLLPSGGISPYLSTENTKKLKVIKSGKGRKSGKVNRKLGEKKSSESLPTSSRSPLRPDQTSKAAMEVVDGSEAGMHSKSGDNVGWIRSLFRTLGLSGRGRSVSGDDQRPPSSGNIDWVVVEYWDDDSPSHKPMKTNVASTPAPTATAALDGFIIGEHDWRDPDLLPTPTSTNIRSTESARPRETKKDGSDKSASLFPSSGEYETHGEDIRAKQDSKDTSEERKGWLSSWFDEVEEASTVKPTPTEGGSTLFTKTTPLSTHGKEDENTPKEPEQHEGLWVTLAPSNMSSSPFLDTLLVLVVSPLVTLTVVYALLLLRSRIRRRRWRAPKSVVERLPVRTYHTISNSNSSPSATPAAASSTTPLLQHTPSQGTPSQSRPGSRTTSEVPATSSSFQPNPPISEEEKREAGLAEWRRRYGGRQRECVVCLEEYVDGVSRVMSLPCGHEFHEDCITPWLVTRRRTCPICKGDVVRSLSRSYRSRNHSSSPERSPRFVQEDVDELQARALGPRDDVASSSQPVRMPGPWAGEYSEESDNDVEANWADNPIENRAPQGRDIPHDRTIDLSSSMRDLSSTVTTVIWRGFDAIRGATGLPRRSSREEVDRDR